MDVAQILTVGDRPEDLEGALRYMRDDGSGAGRHQRGARADRRRSHRRGGRALRRARAGPRREDGEDDREDHRPLRPAAALRPRGGSGGKPKAGDDPRGCDRDRPGRHRPGPGGARRRPGGDRPAGAAAGAEGDVAEGDRDRGGAVGPRRGRAVPDDVDPDVRDPRVGAREEPARDRGGDRPERARDHHLPARAASWSPTSATARAPRGPRRPFEPASPSASAASPTARAARRSRTSSPGCSRGGPWRSPSRAPRGCWPRGSPSVPGPRDGSGGGVVAYSDESKAELLGVDPALIERARRRLA